MLPIVIYTGKTRWTAARRVIDLVTPSASRHAEPDLTSRTNELFAGDGYLTLDTMRVAVNDLPRDNAAALLAGICNPTMERLPEDAAQLRVLLDDPELRPLLEIVLLWADRTAQRSMNFDLGADDMAVVDRLHESGELEDYFAARRRAYQEQFRAEGVEQGIERGLAAERNLLCRQAARKFDPRRAARETAGRYRQFRRSRQRGRFDHRLRHRRGTDRTSSRRCARRFANGLKPSSQEAVTGARLVVARASDPVGARLVLARARCSTAPFERPGRDKPVRYGLWVEAEPR